MTKIIFASGYLQHHAALIERKERQDDGARVVGFYAPTKMFYDLWLDRKDRAIDETDRIHELRETDLIVNKRDPDQLAILDAELHRLGWKRYLLNEYHQWSIVPLSFEAPHE